MKFSTPLEEGLFLKRYKRFFAEIEKNKKVLTAHTPNTGSMKGLLTPKTPCRYTHSADPKRKLKYTLQQLKTPSSWVGVNTHLPNTLVWEAWEEKQIWKSFTHARKEVKLNDHTRIDMALWKTQKGLKEIKICDPEYIKDFSFHFVEIKNVTLAEGDTACFPDAVTTRGQKHILELMNLAKTHHTAELLFLVQREDCSSFSPADSIDPEYGRLLREAKKMGVKVSAFPCSLSKKEICLIPKRLKLKL